jgi:hypothetical protein
MEVHQITMPRQELKAPQVLKGRSPQLTMEAFSNIIRITWR